MVGNGWFKESYRHGLSSRGISTSRNKPRSSALANKLIGGSVTKGHGFLPYVARDGIYSGLPSRTGELGKGAPRASTRKGYKVADEFFAGKQTILGMAKDDAKENGYDWDNLQTEEKLNWIGVVQEREGPEQEYKGKEQDENECEGDAEEITYNAKKYYSEGLLDRPHEDDMKKQIRSRDANAVQEKILAQLTKKVNDGEMTGENRERFMTETFSNEAKLYIDGAIDKEDFDETVNRKAESYMKTYARPHEGQFSFDAGTGKKEADAVKEKEIYIEREIVSGIPRARAEAKYEFTQGSINEE